MARKVGAGSKKFRSTAVRQAGKLGAARVRAKPKAKPTTIVDDRPSQRIPQLKEANVKTIEKGRYEKIPGTRVQSLPGGKPVRIVIEDGKKFEPSNARGARQHLAKLAKAAEELARIRGTPAPPKLATGTKRSQQQPSKKRKTQGRDEDTKRELASECWFQGEVVERVQRQAWIRMQSVEGLPEAVLLRLRLASEERRSARNKDSGPLPAAEEMLLPLRFADVTDRSLQLQPGVAIRFRVCSDALGVRGCEATAPTAGDAEESADLGAEGSGSGAVESGACEASAGDAAVSAELGAAGSGTVEPGACEASAEREAADQAKAEREAAEQAKAKREAAERAMAEREAVEKAQAEREAAERANAEREAAEKAKAEREAATQAKLEEAAKLAAKQAQEDDARRETENNEEQATRREGKKAEDPQLEVQTETTHSILAAFQDGTIPADERAAQVAAVVALGRERGLEDSLLLTLPYALAKAPEERGQFEQYVLNQLEVRLNIVAAPCSALACQKERETANQVSERIQVEDAEADVSAPGENEAVRGEGARQTEEEGHLLHQEQQPDEVVEAAPANGTKAGRDDHEMHEKLEDLVEHEYTDMTKEPEMKPGLLPDPASAVKLQNSEFFTMAKQGYVNMSLHDLRIACSRNGLPEDGTKDDLMERMAEFTIRQAQMPTQDERALQSTGDEVPTAARAPGDALEQGDHALRDMVAELDAMSAAERLEREASTLMSTEGQTTDMDEPFQTALTDTGLATRKASHGPLPHDLGSLHWKRLQEECKKRGLNSTGRKIDMLNRLKNWEDEEDLNAAGDEKQGSGRVQPVAEAAPVIGGIQPPAGSSVRHIPTSGQPRAPLVQLTATPTASDAEPVQLPKSKKAQIEEDLGQLPVEELRAACAELDLPSDGRKEDLLARLAMYADSVLTPEDLATQEAMVSQGQDSAPPQAPMLGSPRPTPVAANSPVPSAQPEPAGPSGSSELAGRPLAPTAALRSPLGPKVTRSLVRDLTALPMKDLRDACKEHGLQASGSKADLVERLTILATSQNSQPEPAAPTSQVAPSPPAPSMLPAPPSPQRTSLWVPPSRSPLDADRDLPREEVFSTPRAQMSVKVDDADHEELRAIVSRDLGALPLSELRGACIRQGLSDKGSKATLVELLTDFAMRSAASPSQAGVNLDEMQKATPSDVPEHLDDMPDSFDGLNGLSLDQLQAACRACGLSTDGDEAELVARLAVRASQSQAEPSQCLSPVVHAESPGATAGRADPSGAPIAERNPPREPGLSAVPHDLKRDAEALPGAREPSSPAGFAKFARAQVSPVRSAKARRISSPRISSPTSDSIPAAQPEPISLRTFQEPTFSIAEPISIPAAQPELIPAAQPEEAPGAAAHQHESGRGFYAADVMVQAMRDGIRQKKEEAAREPARVDLEQTDSSHVLPDAVAMAEVGLLFLRGKELRRACQDRGLKSEGQKEDLIARLCAYFAARTEFTPSFSEGTPSPERVAKPALSKGAPAVPQLASLAPPTRDQDKALPMECSTPQAVEGGAAADFFAEERADKPLLLGAAPLQASLLKRPRVEPPEHASALAQTVAAPKGLAGLWQTMSSTYRAGQARSENTASGPLVRPRGGAETTTGGSGSLLRARSGNAAVFPLGPPCGWSREEAPLCAQEQLQAPPAQHKRQQRRRADIVGTCHGYTQAGAPCQCAGSVRPRGAKYAYCRKHSARWARFEPVGVDQMLQKLPTVAKRTATEVELESPVPAKQPRCVTSQSLVSKGARELQQPLVHNADTERPRVQAGSLARPAATPPVRSRAQSRGDRPDGQGLISRRPVATPVRGWMQAYQAPVPAQPTQKQQPFVPKPRPGAQTSFTRVLNLLPE